MIDNTLRYLREALANHMESERCQQIYDKIESNHYPGEDEFVKDLNEEEMVYLDTVLKKELDYATSTQDNVRLGQLTEVYELLPLE